MDNAAAHVREVQLGVVCPLLRSVVKGEMRGFFPFGKLRVRMATKETSVLRG